MMNLDFRTRTPQNHSSTAQEMGARTPRHAQSPVEIWWPSPAADPELARILELVKKSGLRRAIFAASDGTVGQSPGS